ncbi:MAG: cyclopropane-fatty-acyl-phospholipid synthase family protein [Actinomycetota bacterium]|nr:cyclopropane-fatty-acyl-phospholipid synthase family protein [Actinomycetota bacterium]
MTGAAQRLEKIVRPALGGELPIRLRAWDGSEAGPVDAPTVVVSSPTALRRLLYRPNELGLAQAYVTGEIEVEGDLLDGLRRVWQSVRERGSRGRLGFPAMVKAARAGVELGIVGKPLPPPDSQARLRGRLHTKRRDREAISHHYDLSNDFYSLILDGNKAYSCGYWTSDDPSYTVSDAQRDKLDLICTKLGLGPGMRLLDVGCGWGSLSIHAAQNFGVRVIGVTLSEQQRQFVQKRIDDLDLGGLAEVRRQDYRDVTDGSFDAVCSIEMGEHVGKGNYPKFITGLHALLRPEGRLLIQQMSRKDKHGGGPFIEAFIAPDMYMGPVGETVALIEDCGLEVRDVHALREHYVRTIHAWYRTFEDNYGEAVEMVGEEVARVWRLYLVGSALSFEEGRMGIDQILAVRATADGRSGLPATRAGL